MDLTAATDRFPIELQLQVLSLMGLTSEEVKAWKYLMVGEPFKVPKSWNFPFKDVKFKVGQPMGGRSS